MRRAILAVAILAALAACVIAPSDLRKQKAFAEGDTAQTVPEAAACIASAVGEIWEGYVSGFPSVHPSGERAEVQMHERNLVGIVDIEKRGTGSHIVVHLVPVWIFPVFSTEAASRRMIEMCGGHATPA